MKRENLVERAFSNLGFTPRQGQAEAVDRIVSVFLDEGVSNAIVCAPTGTGKSIIGAAVAEVLAMSPGAHNPKLASVALTATNVLARQHEATFSNLRSSFMVLKGAGNFGCAVLSYDDDPQTAESCVQVTSVKAGGPELKALCERMCDRCEYNLMKKRKNGVRHLSTNYAYYFVDQMYAHQLDARELVIWDEAHLINDLFSEHNAIFFSEERLLKMKKEISEMIPLVSIDMIKTLNKIIDDVRVPERINQGNYKTYLKALVEFYGYVKSEFEEAAISATRTSNTKAYVKMNRATKRYEGLACKIGDFLSFEYPHVFEYKEEEKSVTVKPIFAAEMMETLQLGRFNLFMSATISPAYAERTLGLSDENSRFIQLDPTFPKENKEMVFFDPLPLSYKSLQDPEIVERLCKNVVKIVKHHVELGERGIILTPSFALQKKITDILERQKWFSGVSYFKQERGEKLEPVLREFKDHEGGPALLVSPGMFEGVDLPGDLSRFQILVKAPFPSLADKRAKVILDRYPDVYNITATMKLVQGAGRSVRSATDYAVTYCLDKNAARIFSSKSNIWQNEFTIRHTSFL